MNIKNEIVFFIFTLLCIYVAVKIIRSFRENKIKDENNDFAEITEYTEELKQKLADGFYKSGRLVLFGSYQSYLQAYIIKGLLESNSIYVEIKDENIGLTSYEYALAIGGIKLMVHEAEFEQAQKIVATAHPQELDVQIRKCPRCGSQELQYQKFSKLGFLTMVAIGLPLAIRADKWICTVCNHQWKE